jgi:hypothetical protein
VVGGAYEAAGAYQLIDAQQTLVSGELGIAVI